jgi:predicted lipoprotein with Yx(FWY)xxD motif
VRALSVLALALFALSTSFAESTAAAPRPTVSVRASAYGRILFDTRGFALYAFTKDPRNRSTCSGTCAVRWPPYLVSQSPHADPGAAASKLGTTTRADGSRQVTYAGRPLYHYVGDRAPLQILCQNVREFGGLWLVVRPDGTVVR